MFSRNATKSIILFCLIIFTFGLIGCSNLFNLTPFGNVIFSFKLPSHLQASRGGETSYTLRVSLHEKNDAVFQSVEKIIGGGGEQTLISFPAVPIDKEIYVKASLFKNNSLVYSGKTEVIKVVKGDNRVKLALDKSYMVTFSWEGQTKQIEVKSGNLIPVSEIPEIYAPDGKAVVWYNGNNAFSFSNGINEELTLSSKVVDITAETVCDVIKSCYGDMEQLVKLQGNCSSELVIKMGAALKENPNAKIILDLGDVTGLTEIPNQALASNNALFGIILPKTGLTKIGNWALGALYNVKNIEIPASVTVIDTAAFQECISLESIVIPEGIAQISERTFNWCESLETITIPVTVTSIAGWAFNGCEALTTINYAGTKDLWDEIFIGDKNECLSNATINYGSISEIPTETVEVAASEAANTIAGLSGRNRVIVTGDCDSNTVSAIGNALKNSSAQVLLDLSDVSGLTEILNEAFVSNNNLVEITLPESVNLIADWSFAYSNLRAINIPANVEYIANEAFVGCAQLTNIDVAENNSYFSSENGVIYNKEKTVLLSYPSASGRVEFLDSVIRIGDYAFKNSRIETLNIPDHITSMGVGAFYNCYFLTSVESFGGVSSIPNLAFYCCTNLESITVPENVVSIGWGVFDCCRNLEVVEILGNISVIKERTFGVCDKMHTITIPATVTVIEDNAFERCEGLKTVNYAGTKDLWDQIYIGSGNEYLINAKINYGAVSEVPEIPTNEITVTASEAADTIYNLSGRNLVIVTGDCDSNTVSQIGYALKNSSAQVLLNLSDVNGLTSIPQGCFRDSNSLVEITLPESVTEIGDSAFNSCSSLVAIHSLGRISQIQGYTFAWCDNLRSVTIPSTVTYMEAPFAGCSKLTDIVIEEGNDSYIAENGAIYTTDKETLVAYSSATGEFTIDSSVRRIGASAFANSRITSLVIPENVTEIGTQAFNGCNSLETVEIRANIFTIPEWCFGTSSNLQSITIPSSVQRIESGAFAYCQKLTDIRIDGDNFSVKKGAIYSADGSTLVSYPSASGNVTIPETVTSIANEAFRGCLAESITIPSSVTSIGRYNFNNCQNLKTVEIFAKVSVLPQSLFSYSRNLTSVTIPATVTSIEWGAFDGCSSLSNVTYTGTQEMWNEINISPDGNSYLYNAELTCTGEYQEVPEVPVTEISVEASEAADTIYNLSGRNRLVVTGYCDSEIISQIGSALRENQSAQILLDLSGVSGLTSIPQEAFMYNRSLVEITLPESVTEIGVAAFEGCDSLQTVNSLGRATSIPPQAFGWCDKLETITIPETAKSIGTYAFASCQKLTNIIVEGDTFKVQDGAIYTADGTTLIAYPTAIGSITIPSYVKNIGFGAFIDAEITELIIPSNVIFIDREAFRGCHLNTVIIENGISVIQNLTFGWCQNLTSVTIPATVTSIDERAFEDCENLRYVTYTGTEQMWDAIDIIEDGNSSLYNAELTCTGDFTEVPEIPTESVEVTASAAANKIASLSGRNRVIVTGECDSETVSQIGYALRENQSAQILLDLSGVRELTSIPQECFRNSDSLVEITLPESVIEIGWGAFNQCRQLKIVHSLGSVSELQNNTFGWCENLQSLTIPATVTYMNAPFSGCSKLINIVIEEENNIYIAENGVIYTTDRTTIVAYPSASGDFTIDEAVSRIGGNAFYGSSIKSLIIPETVTEIEWNAFSNCQYLETVEIRANISTIPSWCFGSCWNLQSITIPSSVQCIESGAFAHCENLTDIRIDGDNFIVEDGAIYSANGSTLIAYPSASGNVTVSDTVTSIAEEAFRGCLAESITIPSSVTSIGKSNFNNCNNLVTVEILAKVSVIPQSMFAWSQNLTSVTIPATVTSIEWGVFDGCSSLSNVTYTGTQEMWNEINISPDGNSYLYNAEIECTGDFTEIPTATVEVVASEAASKIKGLSGRNLVIVTGNCDSGIVSQIGNALRDSSAQILLDLSDVSGLTSIPQEAFAYNSSLVEITLPDGVTTIESWCFGVCGNLQSITIPSSVTSIGDSAFIACNNLTIIEIDERNEYFTVTDGAIYTTDGTTLVAYPNASETVEIPYGVTTIGNGAFACSLIEEIILPNSLTEIGVSAFHACSSLESISIPESVTKISQEAFNCCSGLTSIVIPSSVTTIEHGVFHLCSNLQSVEILGNISVIQSRTFENCESLESITIPATVTSIEWGTFNGCSSLSTVTYTGTEQMWNAIDIIEDGNSCLYNASLTCTGDFTEVPTETVEVAASEAADTIAGLSGRNRVIVTGECSSDTVSAIGNALKNSGAQILLDLSDVSELTEIPQVAFAYNSSLVEITLPDGITTIGSDAFNQCRSLQSVYNLGTITTIPRSCFNYCENLQSITIPASVEFIENRAFAGCPKLTNIVIEDGNNNYFAEKVAIYSTDGETLVAYPSASGEITIDSSVKTIGVTAFTGSEITSVTIPATVTNIEWGAFSSCEYLETVGIQANIETIPGSCFESCVNLQSITIPESVECIQNCAFMYCQKLTDISISGNNFIENDGAIYTTDGATLVAYPTAIESVVIPDDVTTIGAGAFAGSLVDSITIPETVTTIESEAFRDCRNLQTVEILAKVSVLPQGMFSWCENLTSVTIPATVIRIEIWAFDGCNNLSSVTFEDTNGWHVGSDGTSVDVTTPSTNAGLLVGDYCDYYWTKVEE